MNEVVKNEEKKLTKREKVLMAGTAVVGGILGYKLGVKSTILKISIGLAKCCEVTPGFYERLNEAINNGMKAVGKK